MQTGRNELCHCGSGKKYKKCCLSTRQSMPKADAAISSLTEIEILNRAIPPAVIQSVMEEIDGWSASECLRLADEFTRRHMVLLAFVASVLISMPPAARDQALLTVFALIRMFERHYGPAHEAIVETDILRLVDRNKRLLANTSKGMLTQKPGDVVQPFALHFLSQVAFDFDVEGDEAFDERDALSILLMLKTTLDVLDHAYIATRESHQPVFAGHE